MTASCDWRAFGAAHLWHPFTQMRGFYEHDALCIVAGEGNEVIDDQGRRYLDAVASLWCNVFGHRRAEIDQAIRDQLDRIAHSTLLGLCQDRAAELAARLIAVAPSGLTRVFYSDSGASAVEVALKIAYQHFRNREGPTTKRTRFARLGNAYHGDTLGAVSVGGIDLFHAAFRPLLFETLRLDAPKTPEDIAAALSALDPHADSLAGVIIEPIIQGAAGMKLHAGGFLRALRDFCDDHGVLLIADEVATGFGRSGRMFACEHEGVTPDLMCLAKGLTGGYLPLAATLSTESVYEAFLGRFEEFRHFFHGHTYTGNALGCAAALATLGIFQRERIIEDRLPHLETELTRRLEPLCEHPHVREVRRVGVMTGIELVADRKKDRPFEVGYRAGHRVILEMRRHGVIARPLGDVVVLNPPLSITDEELDRVFSALTLSLAILQE